MTAKELIRLMRESGTGKAKLDILRALAGLQLYDASQTAKDIASHVADRPHTTAKDVMAWLDNDAYEAHRDHREPVISPTSLAKAWQITRDGVYVPPPQAKEPFPEDMPDNEPQAAPSAPVEPPSKPVKDGKPALVTAPAPPK